MSSSFAQLNLEATEVSSPEQQDYKLSEIRKRADVENGGDLGHRVPWVQLPWLPWLSRSICEPPGGPIAVRPFQKW